MSKLCLIFNTAPHYRDAIYKKIDTSYDCDWYFGESREGIKEMDYGILRNVKKYKSIGNPSKIYWQKGIVSLLFKREYQVYFMLGEVRALSSWVLWLLALLFFPNKKIYLWTHGWYGKESRLELKMKQWLYNSVAGTFTYGEYAKNGLMRLGIDEKKLHVIKNSLRYDDQIKIRVQLTESDIYREHFHNDNPVIIFIGRLTKVKKLEQLIEAVSILKTRGENYNLVLIGDGIEKENLKKLAVDIGVEQATWFYGACYDEKENGTLIYNADLCVSPGNVGLTAMHTLVFGTPVITHDDFKWQMPEFEAIKPGLTGYFFEYGNVDDLAKKISNWFDAKSQLREDVRRACFEEIDTYWNPNYQMEIISKNLIIE